MRIVLAAALAAGGWAQEGGGSGILNLSCMEALAVVDAAWLSGVFSFVPEKDSALAFADMVVRNKSAMRKYVAKLMKDLRVSRGITTWDHEVVMQALAIYASPLGETVGKPDPTTRERLNTLGLAPTMTLAEVSARRKGE